MNKPFTAKQVENLPIGFTQTAIEPNRKQKRDLLNATPYRINNREVTSGRAKNRNHDNGRTVRHIN